MSKALRLAVERLEDRAVPSTFTVTNTASSGSGSLRQAILDANATAGADTIAFAIPGSGVQTITPLSAIPTVTDPVTMTGRPSRGSPGRR